MTATLNINLSEGLTSKEIELLAAQAEAEAKSIDQVIMDAIRATISARRPEPTTIAA
jgi:hypothetical protein